MTVVVAPGVPRRSTGRVSRRLVAEPMSARVLRRIPPKFRLYHGAGSRDVGLTPLVPRGTSLDLGPFVWLSSHLQQAQRDAFGAARRRSNAGRPLVFVVDSRQLTSRARVLGIRHSNAKPHHLQSLLSDLVDLHWELRDWGAFLAERAASPDASHDAFLDWYEGTVIGALRGSLLVGPVRCGLEIDAATRSRIDACRLSLGRAPLQPGADAARFFDGDDFRQHPFRRACLHVLAFYGTLDLDADDLAAIDARVNRLWMQFFSGRFRMPSLLALRPTRHRPFGATTRIDDHHDFSIDASIVLAPGSISMRRASRRG